MYTLQKALKLLYEEYPTVSQRDIQEILAWMIGEKQETLWLNLEKTVEQEIVLKIAEKVKQKEEGMPLAYLLGHIAFYHCTLDINAHVIVPRVETEIVLDLVLKEAKKRSIQVAFDVCTGSGCLGIGFKKHYGACQMYLSDISPEALELAKHNALKNEVAVTCLLGDLMEPFANVPKADLVLCNPPYISDLEFEDLEPSVKHFEPRRALTSGPSGLEIFQKLAIELPAYMNPGGLLVLEIGSTQKESINKIFSCSPWRNFKCYQDYAGLDRAIFLEME